MNSKLIVNGVELDLSESIAVPLNLSITDVKEPEKRKRSYSKSIKLEGTSNNMSFFLSAYSLSMDVLNSSNVSFDPSIRNPCEFYKDDLLVFKGKLKLNEVIIQDKNYYFDCTLFSDAVDIFAKLKDIKLNELDWSEFNHNLTVNTVTNSWFQGVYYNGSLVRNFGSDNFGYQPQSYGYVYPIIDYAFSKPSEITFRTNQLYPFIYVKQAFIKALLFALQGENIDIDYSTIFFNNPNMQKLIYGYGGGEQLKLSQAVIDLCKVELLGYINSQTVTGVQKVQWSGATMKFLYYQPAARALLIKQLVFTGASWNANSVDKNNNLIKINQKAKYNFSITFDFTTSSTGQEVPQSYFGATTLFQSYVVLNVNGKETKQTFAHAINTTQNHVIEFEKDLNAGDVVKVYTDIVYYLTKPDLTFEFNNVNVTMTANKNTPVADNDLITLNTAIPDIKCSDFIKGIMNLFYAYMSDPIYDPVTNRSTITIESFINYYETPDNYDDWTGKVDNSREINIQSNSLSEGSNYIYKFSDEKDFFNSEYKRLTGLNYGEKSIELSTWATGDVKFELPFNTYVPTKIANTDIIYTKIIDQTIDNANKTTIKPYKGKGMLSFYNGLRTGSVEIMNNNNNDKVVTTQYPLIHHIRYRNNQNFEPLFDLHFASRNYSFDGLNAIPLDRNTYDYYHSRFINEIVSPNSKLVSLYLNLDYKDIHDLDFSKLKMIDGILYRLNAIKDFDKDAYGTTQVELLKYLG